MRSPFTKNSHLILPVQPSQAWVFYWVYTAIPICYATLLRRFIELDRYREVLEIGCGDGRLTFRYAQWTKRVYAIDTDSSSIEAARASMPPELLQKFEFQQAAIEHSDFPAEQFDICLLAWSL